MALCSLIKCNEYFEEANCSHPKITIMLVQQKFLIYVGKFLPTNNVSHSNRQHSLLFLHRITEHSSMYCIMTQKQAMSNSTVRSRNTFHLSWCVSVQTHTEKAVCTKHSIWLSLNTATTALSRMLAMFKVHICTSTSPNCVLCKNLKYIHILYQHSFCSVMI